MWDYLLDRKTHGQEIRLVVSPHEGSVMYKKGSREIFILNLIAYIIVENENSRDTTKTGSCPSCSPVGEAKLRNILNVLSSAIHNRSSRSSSSRYLYMWPVSVPDKRGLLVNSPLSACQISKLIQTNTNPTPTTSRLSDMLWYEVLSVYFTVINLNPKYG